MNDPQTLKQAQAKRYAAWAGNPNGYAYIPGRCAYEVQSQDGWHSYQCARKNGYGPEGLYCKQHAKRVAGRP